MRIRFFLAEKSKLFFCCSLRGSASQCQPLRLCRISSDDGRAIRKVHHAAEPRDEPKEEELAQVELLNSQ